MECLHASWQGQAGQTPEMHSSHCKWTQKIQCWHSSPKRDQARRRGQTLWMRQGYTFFWSGHGPEERCEAGVGFAVKSKLVGKLTGPLKGVNDCLMTMRLPFSNGQKFITIVSAYAPTMTNPDEVKDRFMKTWTLSSPLFPALINSSFLVTLMWELAVTAPPGKEWSGSMGLATATAMAYYSSRPVLNMSFGSLTLFSTFLPTTGHHGCILALSIGISLIMSLGRGTGRMCGSKELCVVPSAGQTTVSSSPSSTSASSPRDIHRAWKHPNAWMSTS